MPRWVGMACLRSPLLWLWMALGAFAWPTLSTFAEHAITVGEQTTLASLYELAFISLQLGAWCGLTWMERGRSLFARTDPRRRIIAEGTGLLVPCLIFGAAGSIGPIVWTVAGPGLGDATFLPRLIGGGLHLTGVALVLLHLPLGPWSRRVLLPLLTWVLPALMGPEAALAPWIQRVFGVASELLPDGFLTPTPVAYHASLWAQLATLCGWFLLAWMTVPGRARDYALRDPR